MHQSNPVHRLILDNVSQRLWQYCGSKEGRLVCWSALPREARASACRAGLKSVPLPCAVSNLKVLLLTNRIPAHLAEGEGVEMASSLVRVTRAVRTLLADLCSGTTGHP